MLSLSKHWLSQQSFANLYPFYKIRSPLGNNLLYNRARFTPLEITDFHTLLNNIFVNDKYKLDIAAKYGLLNIIKYILKTNPLTYPFAPFVIAVRYNQTEVINYLINLKF